MVTSQITQTLPAEINEEHRAVHAAIPVRSQTQTVSIEDRVKKRQAYLVKKGGAYSLAAMSGIVSTMVFTLMTLLLILIHLPLGGNYCTKYDPCIPLWETYKIIAPWLIGGVIVGSMGIIGCHKGMKRSKNLTYVPPVADQIAALPAVEVLVRGSDQPVSRPCELLRAARAGETTETGELLRPCPGALRSEFGAE